MGGVCSSDEAARTGTRTAAALEMGDENYTADSSYGLPIGKHPISAARRKVFSRGSFTSSGSFNGTSLPARVAKSEKDRVLIRSVLCDQSDSIAPY